MRKINNIFENLTRPRVILSFLIGVTVGYIYSDYLKCTENVCYINNNPYNLAIYFGVLGMFFAYGNNKKEHEKINSYSEF